MITEEEAYEIFSEVQEQYMTNLNNCIAAFNINRKSGNITTYSQRELEAMFDYSYNNGLSPVKHDDGYYSPAVDNKNKVFYYYLTKDLVGAVDVVKEHNSDSRRRLNQMNLFFKNYVFLDKSEEGLDPLRKKLGFFGEE